MSRLDINKKTLDIKRKDTYTYLYYEKENSDINLWVYNRDVKSTWNNKPSNISMAIYPIKPEET